LDLNQRHGLTKRKTCQALSGLFGLHLSPGGLVSATHRMASRLGNEYDQLVEQARQASVVHADETSWWVGGPGWQLWVFTNDDLTVYRVRDSRGRKVVHETLGRSFPGVLVSDCLSSYDNASPIQHKCYAHHLKAINEATSRHPAGGEGFLRQITALLKAAQVFKRLMPELSESQRQKMRQSLESEADRLLASRKVEPSEASVANRLRKQRDHLFTFLDYDEVQATNNQAERQLRPAVIARKVSCGNRTKRGARTWETLASLAATCTQRGGSFRELITNAARLPP
jgi:transposase